MFSSTIEFYFIFCISVIWLMFFLKDTLIDFELSVLCYLCLTPRLHLAPYRQWKIYTNQHLNLTFIFLSVSSGLSFIIKFFFFFMWRISTFTVKIPMRSSIRGFNTICISLTTLKIVNNGLSNFSSSPISNWESRGPLGRALSSGPEEPGSGLVWRITARYVNGTGWM